MGKSSLSVVFSAGRVFLPVLFIAVLFCSPASAVGVTDAGVNQMISVQTPASPLDQQGSPKKLWMKYGKAYAPNFYAQVYRFTVTPGQKYTLYGTFPPDGSYRNLYVTGENPLTDYAYSLDSKGDMTGFVFWSQQPGKWQCPAVTRRVNIEISPRSEHHYLYAVAVTQKPGLAFSMMLKNPGDSDPDVANNTQDPSCPPRKGNTWGQTWGRPLILLLDPTEKEKTAAKPVTLPVTKPLDVVDVPLNQTVNVQTAAVALDQPSSPKKLWERYGKGYAPNFYTRIYRFTVNPGEKYTLYGFFPPDGVYRNFYILGDNPLTDTTWAFGNTQGVSTGFVFWFQQPGKWQCPAVTRRVNITISPRSEHRYLYLVATSKAPLQSFQVLLKSPADPDNDVEKSTVDPSCPAKKGQTWGQVWGNPILLRNDPGEQGKTPAVPPDPVNPPAPLPPPIPQPEPKPGPTGKGIWIEAEKESSHQVADSRTSLKLGPGNHSTTSGYWYMATGGDWLMYQVDIQNAGTYFLWVKDYNDRKHPVESRTVDILVDGKKVASLAATDNPGKENWGWHIASMVELSAGNHILMVKKQATTPAAALLDAFYLTPDPSDRPQQ